jgi:hypothetical protein
MVKPNCGSRHIFETKWETPMESNRNVSPRALLLAVLSALFIGVIGSLAIRPPGATASGPPRRQPADSTKYGGG